MSEVGIHTISNHKTDSLNKTGVWNAKCWIPTVNGQ